MSRLEFTLAQLDILTSFALSAFSLCCFAPSWYDQSYTVPMPCSGLEKLSPDPFMMLMMHYSASFTSLASPNHFFDAFLTLLLNALPHQAQGSTSQKWPLRDHPPHTPFIHFVHPKNSSLAYRLAFVKNHLVISSDPHHDYLLTFPVIPTNCPGEGARN